jgi:hypothetical protein
LARLTQQSASRDYGPLLPAPGSTTIKKRMTTIAAITAAKRAYVLSANTRNGARRCHDLVAYSTRKLGGDNAFACHFNLTLRPYQRRRLVVVAQVLHGLHF